MDSEATHTKEYKKIKVTPPITAEKIDTVSSAGHSILIMGPTGAGKSTFIEALGFKGTESISSNQLEGFTQTVSTYRVNNVTMQGYLIYIVDSPGFADTKISELNIVSLLVNWMQNTGNSIFGQILYLLPVTQVRLPGSQRRVLRTFQALTGMKTAESITIVTTMWDSIWGERAKQRAEETFNQLQNDVWKEFIQEGAQIVKFDNTQVSALTIIDDALSRTSWYSPAIGRMFAESKSLQQTPFGMNLYNNLHERIQNLQSEIINLQSDLAHAEEQDDQPLLDVLHPRLREAEKYLMRFQQELQDFGPAPNPYESDGSDVEQDNEQLNGEGSKAVHNIPDIFQIAQGASHPSPPALTTSSPLPPPTQNTTNTSPPAALPHSTSNKTPTAPTTKQGLQDTDQVSRPPRGRLARIVHSIMCPCCGKSVAENHGV